MSFNCADQELIYIQLSIFSVILSSQRVCRFNMQSRLHDSCAYAVRRLPQECELQSYIFTFHYAQSKCNSVSTVCWQLNFLFSAEEDFTFDVMWPALLSQSFFIIQLRRQRSVQKWTRLFHLTRWHSFEEEEEKRTKWRTSRARASKEKTNTSKEINRETEREKTTKCDFESAMLIQFERRLLWTYCYSIAHSRIHWPEWTLKLKHYDFTV